MNPVAATRMTARTATAAIMGIVISEGFSVEQKTTKKLRPYRQNRLENKFLPYIYLLILYTHSSSYELIACDVGLSGDGLRPLV